MSWLRKRIPNIFSSSMPTTQIQETSSLDGEGVNDADTNHAPEADMQRGDGLKRDVLPDMEFEMELADFNGFEDTMGKANGGEAAETLKASKKKQARKERKRKKKQLRAQKLALEVEHDAPQPEKIIAAEKETSAPSAPSSVLGINDAAEEKRPKGKRARRTNGVSMMMAQGEGSLIEDDTVEEDDNADIVAEFLNLGRKSAMNAVKPVRSKIFPQAATKQTISQSDLVEGPAGEETIPEHSSELPKKVKKPKKKLKESSKKMVGTALVNGREDDHDEAALLRQALKPAFTAPPITRNPEQVKDNEDIAAQLQQHLRTTVPPDYADNDAEPEQPSEKALGKRKASDVILPAVKKVKRGKDRETPNADIRKFGTISSQAVATSRSRSVSNVPGVGPARSLDQENITENDMSPVSPPPAANLETSNVKPVRISRDTPQWSPINRRRTLAVVIPEVVIEAKPQVLEHKPILPPKRKYKQIMSESGSEEAEKPEEPEPARLPLRNQSQLISRARESEESNQPEEPKTITPLSRAQKKRRLPTGEPGGSEVPSGKTIARKVTPKTPRAKSGKTIVKAAPTSSVRLTAEEIEAITDAVEAYREEHDLDQQTLNELIQQDAAQLERTDGKTLWDAIYEEVPSIPRQKVKNICRRKFHNFEARGAWTEEQDEELREAYDENPNKWKIIGASINRFPEDARDRWRNYLVCGDNRRKDAWDKEEENNLRQVIQDCLETIREMKRESDDPRLDSRDDESLLDWNTVSKKMGYTRSRLQCMSKWKILKDRETSDAEDVKLPKIGDAQWRFSQARALAQRMKPTSKLRLLRAIHDTGAGREGKIPWRIVSETMNGKGKIMALKACFRALRLSVPGNNEMKFQDIVSLLIRSFEDAAPNEPEGFENINKFFSSQFMSSQVMRSTNGYLVDDYDDNGEGPSTKKTRKSSVKKKRKLTDKMKRADQSQSQETHEEDRLPVQDGSEDIGAIFQSAWHQASPNEAMEPLLKRKSSRKKKSMVLSESHVIEDDEEQVPASDNSPQPKETDEALANGHSPRYHETDELSTNGYSPSNNEDEGELDVDDDDYTAPDRLSSSEQELPRNPFYVDDDYYHDEENPNIIMNRWDRDGSPDLDTPLKMQRLGSSFGDGAAEKHGYDRSSSASSIPAIAREWTHEERVARERSVELG